MKPAAVNILLLVSFLVSIFLFHQKFKGTNSEIDRLKTTIAPVRNFLKPGSVVYVKDQLNRADLIYQTRYVLAPVQVVVSRTGLEDTLLFIAPANSSDSFSSIIWSGFDGGLGYYLTVKK